MVGSSPSTNICQHVEKKINQILHVNLRPHFETQAAIIFTKRFPPNDLKRITPFRNLSQQYNTAYAKWRTA